MKPIVIALLAGVLLALTAAPGRAQYVVSAKSGTINLTEGQVQLDGQKVDSSITRYPAIKEASVLRTGDGRAEVLLTPGVTLRLGDHASLKMITNRLIDTRLELLGGSAVVEADLVGKDTSVTMVVNGAAVTLPKAGIYRFSFDPAQVKVYKGEAAVLAGSVTTLVGAGRMCALGATTAAVQKFPADDTDALDHWSRRRGELMSMANTASTNAPISGNGFYGGAGFMAGLGMPFMGCSGYGMMPGFGYAGSLWAMGNPYAAYPASGVWSYNSWYDMFTYMPCGGAMYSPYGYPYARPVGVGKSPTTVGSVPTHRPMSPPVHRPSLATMSALGDRRPMALAVNGLRGSWFAPAARMSYGYRSAVASPGFGGFASSGVSNSGSLSTSVVATPSATAISATSTAVGGAVSTRGGGGGGGHR